MAASDPIADMLTKIRNASLAKHEKVEITKRSQVFYPDKTGIDYLTIRGLILEKAATNWAPPSAEQPGLIGTRWGKGWIIENNTIRYSRCSGIALGRPTYGHAHHYQKMPPRIYAEENSGQTEEQLFFLSTPTVLLPGMFFGK